MNTELEEKRRFERIFHDANLNLITANGAVIQCKLLDISLNGCLVFGNEKTTDFRIKDKLTVDITLTEAVSIEASAHIVFIGKDMQLGFQFDEIDIDSVTSLRRLVELNIGDSTLLERNLLSLSTQSSAGAP